MAYPRHPENIKVCPECGTNLSYTAKRCVVCGYQFAEDAPVPRYIAESAFTRKRPMPFTISLPALLGIVILIVAVNILVIFGMQKRDETKLSAAAAQATATFLATTYISPTPTLTPTFTPAPPTLTPVVDIRYTVVEGDSCLSIADRFDIYLDSLLSKNDIDCAALAIGTELRIPQPTATPVGVAPASTPEP